MNSTGRPQITQPILKAAAGVAALAAIAFGASAIASGSKSNNASFAGGPPGMAAANGQAPPGMPPSGTGAPQTGASPSGAPPAGAPPAGFPGPGASVTGAAAAKAKAAALARYPGTVERVDQAPDGGYVVHVIRSGGEVHVLVSKQFEVTGTFAGPPRGAGPPQQAPPAKNGSST
jgi:hypothetical protein